MKLRWLLPLCLLVFVYTLVTRAPLAVIYPRLKPADAEVDVVGLDGSLARGSAAGVAVRGQSAVRDLRWELRPWQLLLGRAAFRVDGKGDGLLLDGEVAQTLFGELCFRDFRASGSIKPLLPRLRRERPALKLFLPIDGMLGLDAQTLVLRDGLPKTAQGRLDLDSLAWKLGREPLPLGDFAADVAPEADGLGALIKTKRGPLDVSGDAHLRADRHYEMHLQIRAKADAPPQLVNMLATLGAPDNQGFFHIRRSGDLAAPAAPVVQAVQGASESD